MKTPTGISLYDGSAECYNEDFDDMGGGAFCIDISCTIYESKYIKKLVKFLEKAEKWLLEKEKK